MRPLAVADYCRGVLAGDTRLVAKAITLLESRRAEHRALGQEVLEALMPHTGGALRVGITGPPGVGKSTLIEALGLVRVAEGERVAVLAVDPTSPVSGGSILGDKTRMEQLAREPRAFIRPSPSGGMLGGVAHRTREALLICEAAGYDTVFVETVGVGQSEVDVRSMVDFFCVLLQPGAGDALQGIKRGVLELADALVVHKADGEGLPAAERARIDYEQALGLLRPAADGWRAPVLLASARTGQGIVELWEAVLAQRDRLERSGEHEQRRSRQAMAWLWRLLEDGLAASFRSDPGVTGRLGELERLVQSHATSAPRAAEELLERFRAPKSS